jgi:hypothetical protein
MVALIYEVMNILPSLSSLCCRESEKQKYVCLAGTYDLHKGIFGHFLSALHKGRN